MSQRVHAGAGPLGSQVVIDQMSACPPPLHVWPLPSSPHRCDSSDKVKTFSSASWVLIHVWPPSLHAFHSPSAAVFFLERTGKRFGREDERDIGGFREVLELFNPGTPRMEKQSWRGQTRPFLFCHLK